MREFERLLSELFFQFFITEQTQSGTLVFRCYRWWNIDMKFTTFVQYILTTIVIPCRKFSPIDFYIPDSPLSEHL